MTSASWVELCVSDLDQSIRWFEHVLDFRVIALESNEFVELSSGETSILLASDDAPSWASERPHLLPSGQRGSGVEIILLVDNVEAVYRQAQQSGADILRELADFPWHLRQFWVRHPDGYLICPAQKTYQNREIQDLFVRYRTMKSFVGRDQLRETLFIK